VLALAGDLGADDLVERAVQGALARLGAGEAAASPPALVVAPGEARLSLPRLEAARLLMAWWLPPAADLDGVMGADLATTVLAEGRRSRLLERLREQLRIVESIDLDLHAMESGSLGLLEAVCDGEDLPAVRQAIGQVWNDVMEQPIGDAEWQRAQRLVSNSYRFGLEAAAGVAGLIGSNQLWGRRGSLARPLELLQGWTPARLQQEALSLLAPERACVLEAVPA
jgi:predicted Zn-dependent peptidase